MSTGDSSANQDGKSPDVWSEDLAKICLYVSEMQKLKSSTASSDKDTDDEQEATRSSSNRLFVRKFNEGDRLKFWQSHYYQEIDAAKATEETLTGKVIFSKHDLVGLDQLENANKGDQNKLVKLPPKISLAESRKGTKNCWARFARLEAGNEGTLLEENGKSAIAKYLKKFKENHEGTWDNSAREQALRDLQTSSATKTMTKENTALKDELVTRFLLKQAYRRVYEQLYEWAQSTRRRDSELVCGIGSVRLVSKKKNEMANGPLMEIPIEVELDSDGSLLVRPRECAQMGLNDEVAFFLQASLDCSMTKVKDEAAIQPPSISLNNLEECKPFLEDIARRLSPHGCFQTDETSLLETENLLVAQGWCIYERNKSSLPSARDADVFAKSLRTSNTEKIPLAALVLTRGPQAIREKKVELKETQSYHPKVHPLPVSSSQQHVLDLLLESKVPAVVLQGPPGTGKTHTIRNVISAYLRTGMRVLVHSKGAQALSVIGDGLPESIRDLCINISTAESSSDMQLQQSVDRLLTLISDFDKDVEAEKIQRIESEIDQLEEKKALLDEALQEQHKYNRSMFELYVKAPSLVESILGLSLLDATKLRDEIVKLVEMKPHEQDKVVLGDCPLSDDFIEFVDAKSQRSFSLWQSLGTFVSSIVSSVIWSKTFRQITINDKVPESEDDWKKVLATLRYKKALAQFKTMNIAPKLSNELFNEVGGQCQHGTIRQVDKVVNLRQHVLSDEECSELERQRGKAVEDIRKLAEKLANKQAVAELSNNCSESDLAAMVRFSQIAASSKFCASSKKSDKQQRCLDEYKDAFMQCMKIPCWIMTTSQINEFLAAEPSSFDLVVLDEASQSDITVLPAMLRGKQWLIVGDSKQVSPTDAFLGEKTMGPIVSILPQCPFHHSMKPGQSFFDLCEQAFAKHCRVVLREHFRMRPELIPFSNNLCYDGKLIPLRPSPSIAELPPKLDVRVEAEATAKVNVKAIKGKRKTSKGAKEKEGKETVTKKKAKQINKAECDEIVNRIDKITADGRAPAKTIGVVTLLGQDQGPFIEKELLDRIGPVRVRRHNILVGDPTKHQGSERDIIFLSMVCSPGNTRSQSKLMHVQRFNVAFSRARDQEILVRSIDAKDVQPTDLKYKAIEFFDNNDTSNIDVQLHLPSSKFGELAEKLKGSLQKQGLMVHGIGKVWNQGLCIQQSASHATAAICIAIAGETEADWNRMVVQQRSLERVGRSCHRVNALSLLIDYDKSLNRIKDFLKSAGFTLPEEADNKPLNEDPVVEAMDSTDLHDDGALRGKLPRQVSIDEGQVSLCSSDGSSAMEVDNHGNSKSCGVKREGSPHPGQRVAKAMRSDAKA